MRSIVLWAVLIILLVLVNLQIKAKEEILVNGEIVLLQLAPRDPRSLLQGDFMTLRYSLAEQIRTALKDRPSADGDVVLSLDEKRIASFVRLHDSSAGLGNNEMILYYRKRGNEIRLAGNAFFFQEGHGSHYNAARYGELRVDASGKAILTGLRDQNAEPLLSPVDPPHQSAGFP